MTTPDLIWANLLVIGLAYELFTLVDGEDGNTLSERVRAWFRVHTRPGRAVFALDRVRRVVPHPHPDLSPFGAGPDYVSSWLCWGS
ncbi:hypothetical protein [Streptomyces sp. NPDC051636]|uniref:hypothetical protein n=1 Tax=Streptomyces sp. NPDC051636 TaxID=3365663 RepID=UPI0037946A03